MDHETLMTLMLGVFLVLAVATLTGGFLSIRVTDGPNRSVVENLNARIWAWWVMVILLGLSFFWGRTGVTLLFAVCSFNALREFITLTNARRADHWMLAADFVEKLGLICGDFGAGSALRVVCAGRWSSRRPNGLI